MKSKTTAALLAFFLGGLGGHKFYLGKAGQGILYLVFFWTLIPSVVAFIEAILFLTMSDLEFHARYNAGMPYLGLVGMPAASPQNIVVNVANTAQGAGPDVTPKTDVAGRVDVAAKIKQLHELRTVGALTELEFEDEKRKVLLGS